MPDEPTPHTTPDTDADTDAAEPADVDIDVSGDEPAPDAEAGAEPATVDLDDPPIQNATSGAQAGPSQPDAHQTPGDYAAAHDAAGGPESDATTADDEGGEGVDIEHEKRVETTARNYLEDAKEAAAEGQNIPNPPEHAAENAHQQYQQTAQRVQQVSSQRSQLIQSRKNIDDTLDRLDATPDDLSVMQELYGGVRIEVPPEDPEDTKDPEDDDGDGDGDGEGEGSEAGVKTRPELRADLVEARETVGEQVTEAEETLAKRQSDVAVLEAVIEKLTEMARMWGGQPSGEPDGQPEHGQGQGQGQPQRRERGGGRGRGQSGGGQSGPRQP